MKNHRSESLAEPLTELSPVQEKRLLVVIDQSYADGMTYLTNRTQEVHLFLGIELGYIHNAGHLTPKGWQLRNRH